MPLLGLNQLTKLKCKSFQITNILLMFLYFIRFVQVFIWFSHSRPVVTILQMLLVLYFDVTALACFIFLYLLKGEFD